MDCTSRAASSHHGGCMWMTSLGAGLSWAAVSLLNNTNVRPVFLSEARRQSWWSSLWGGWCSQSASCMPHSSWTSSTSSTITPGLSTGEQSNNNTDVSSVKLHVCSVNVGLITQAEGKSSSDSETFLRRNNKPQMFSILLGKTFSSNNEKSFFF